MNLAVSAPPPSAEIFLSPGEVVFTQQRIRLGTLLGSCVAVALWHPNRHIGGMCHYLLPRRGRSRTGTPDGRYGDEAFDLLVRAIRRVAATPGEFEAGIFGGGNMFPGQGMDRGEGIGVRNIAAARQLAAAYGLRVRHEDVGGTGYRRILLDLAEGPVLLRRAAAGNHDEALRS